MPNVKKQLTLAAAVAAAVAVPSAAFATNGMNMEGYGPIATGMGGASMAYDNGSAATMNNPATIGLMGEGNRLDAALGILGPNITTSAPAGSGFPDADSDATQFIMPAIGWVKRQGQLSYGAALFGQGGMGTEYDANSFLAAGSGEEVRSEVSVGRLLAPVVYNVDDKLSIGGTVDFVWAGMDLKMALPGNDFLAMMPGGSQTLGVANGSLVQTFNVVATNAGVNPVGPVNWGRFDFSDSSDFTGEAQGMGFAGKIGAVYKINNKITIGGAYHSKTSLGDLETNDAKLTINANVDDNVLNNTYNPFTGAGVPAGTYTAVPITLNGEVKVKDFQWPDMLALGVAFQAMDNLLLVADYKRINWSGVMKDFSMTFTADASQTGLAQGFASNTLDVSFFQEWDDQNVFMLGGAYKVNDPLTLRAGLNLANNPVPDEYMNPLFPAIIKNHVSFGAGYQFTPESSFNGSLVYAPEVSQTNSNTGVETTHSQINWQFMYSYRF